MAIYVVTHKPIDFPPMDGYRVIQAGAWKKHIKADDYDDSGENISDRNANYCELTALYWIWKNGTGNIIGLTHYRRMFSNRWNDNEVLEYKDAYRILQKYDVILPQIAYQNCSIQEEYEKTCGKKEDLIKTRNILRKRCPEYVNEFDQYMRGRKTCFLNMLICRRNLLDQYCRWLFPILFELEKQIDLSEYNAYQSRVFGFLAERLLNVWVLHQKLKVCHIFIVEKERQLDLFWKFIYRFVRVATYRLQMI